MSGETRFCPHCGAEGDRDDRFCRTCGADLTTQVFASGPARDDSSKTTRTALLAVVGVVILAVLAGGAFIVGRDTAPTQQEIDAAELEARQASAQAASNAATGGRENAGYEAGVKLGEQNGRKRGTKAGTTAGSADVDQRRQQEQAAAAEQQRRAQAAQEKDAKERLLNCTYLGPTPSGNCPNDEEFERDQEAQTLCAAGKTEDALARGITCDE